MAGHTKAAKDEQLAYRITANNRIILNVNPFASPKRTNCLISWIFFIV